MVTCAFSIACQQELEFYDTCLFCFLFWNRRLPSLGRSRVEHTHTHGGAATRPLPKPNSRATLQRGLDQMSKMEEIVSKMARQWVRQRLATSSWWYSPRPSYGRWAEMASQLSRPSGRPQSLESTTYRRCSCSCTQIKWFSVKLTPSFPWVILHMFTLDFTLKYQPWRTEILTCLIVL